MEFTSNIIGGDVNYGIIFAAQLTSIACLVHFYSVGFAVYVTIADVSIFSPLSFPYL